MNEQWVNEAINLAWGLRYNEIADATALRAHLSTPPEGFVLVPVEPTPEMVEVAMRVKRVRLLDMLKDIRNGGDGEKGRGDAVVAEWAAMIAAAKEKA